MTNRILVVDDEPGMRKSLGIILRRAGYVVTEAPGGKEAADLFGKDVFDLVISDLKMEPLSGLDLLRQVKQLSHDVEGILMTGYGTIEAAVEAMKLGAFDFITKPFQPEEILLRVRNALEKRRLKAEVHHLRVEVKSAFGFEGIVGQSEGIRQVLAILPRAAQSDSTVLVTGESGTGKELVARAIHTASRRAQGPFVSVSCAAFPEHLLENELFGHVKGAFTGALAARRGLLEEAHGGTFFLDEIGEAPLPIQTKLLRVLEDRSIRRLGDNRSVPVDVRIVAATNRDLQIAVSEKSFRDDLFYRLNVIRIHVPPLRERTEDIPLLARHFLAQHCQRLGRDLDGFSPAALQILAAYDFPGNIRELGNVVEQAVALAVGPMIEPNDLHEKLLRPETAAVSTASAPPGPKSVAALERDLIVERLKARGGNLGLVAKDLGISRTTLWRRMKEFQIETRGTERADVAE
ncbi:MAG: sigma-54-dependent transcriptional regulator [Candidatus Methylomirabilales bacterium]